MWSPTLRQLEVFLAVARRRSFTAAARDLRVTQPAVSMQVRELEAGCGMPLLERVGRRIALTEAGEELARGAERIASGLEQTRERLAALRGLRTGQLKLGAVSTAKYFAPALLAAFKRRYPGATIRFAVGNREEMTRNLAEGESDLVIMGRPPPEPETVAEPFARHPFVVVAPPSHPLAGRRRIPLRTLAGESFLIRERGSGTRAAMEEAFRAAAAGYETSMEASSNETIKQAVIAGMGVSFISLHTVGLELQAGRLVVLDVEGLPVMRDWFVIHLERRRLSPVAAAFRSLLLDDGARILAAAVQEQVAP